MPNLQQKKLYVICNSHMDPVWLWRRTSGRSTWLNTVHAVIRMVERHPELKFSCSSAAMYRYIEECAPSLFAKIQELVRGGRWEIVGGWEVQSDAIVASTESLVRQALSGKAYFQEKFGVDVKIAFSADAFGHSAHLPKILNATGFTHYVFLRPTDNIASFPLLFDWRSEDGSEVRALRILDSYNYENCSKAEYFSRIQQHLASPLPAQTLFFGTGDHGGGIYETHYQWLHEAAAQFGFEIVFSTMAEYFEAVRDAKLPRVDNTELGLVFRGCYAACSEVKSKIDKAMRRMTLAERCGASAAELAPAWRELLFHHFHDTLSGTATREVYEEDVFPALGSVLWQAEDVVNHALHRRAESLDTGFLQEGGVYLWNPQNIPVKGIFSFPGFSDPNETDADFNALQDKDGKLYPLQTGADAPSTFGPCGAHWGMLSGVIPMQPGEEKVLAYARVAQPDFPNVGFAAQYALLPRISFPAFYDDCGTWGFTLSDYLRPDTVAELLGTEEFIDGPVYSVLRADYRIGQSKIQLDIYQYANIKELKLRIRIDWQEKLHALKLAVLHQCGGSGAFHTGTPGGAIARIRPGFEWKGCGIYHNERRPVTRRSGELSMVEWCATEAPNHYGCALYSSNLHSCDYAEGAMRITLLRATPYADHHPFPRNESTGYMEMGLSFCEVWFAEFDHAVIEQIPSAARRRLLNIEAIEITAHEAAKSEFGWEKLPVVTPPEVVLEAARKGVDGKWELHFQNYGDAATVTLPDGSTATLPAKSLKIVHCRK